MDGAGGQRHAPAFLSPSETQYTVIHYTGRLLSKYMVLSGCVWYAECYVATILAPLQSPYTTTYCQISNIRPQHYVHTSATWKTKTQHVSLRSK